MNEPKISAAWAAVVEGGHEADATTGDLDTSSISSPPDGLISGNVTIADKAAFDKAVENLRKMTDEAKRKYDLEMQFADSVRLYDRFTQVLGSGPGERYGLWGTHLGDEESQIDPSQLHRGPFP